LEGAIGQLKKEQAQLQSKLCDLEEFHRLVGDSVRMEGAVHERWLEIKRKLTPLPAGPRHRPLAPSASEKSP
jgi:hypothetical protein